MLEEVKEKVVRIRRASAHMWGGDSFSWHHLYIFLTSSNGQKRIVNFIWKANKYVFRKILGIKPDISPAYDKWLKKHTPGEAQLHDFRQECLAFRHRPVISVIAFANGYSHPSMLRLIQSLTDQVYDRWELVIVDKPDETLPGMEQPDPLPSTDNRVRVVSYPETGIPGNKSIADWVSGEYIAVAGPGGHFGKHAFYRFVSFINMHPDADVIYSDDDETDDSGRYINPFFKPDWCPDSFLSRNYIGNAAIIRKQVLIDAGCDDAIQGAGGYYDLLLRVTGHTRNIFHIPDVLYHAGTRNIKDDITGSVTAIQRFLDKKHIPGSVTVTDPNKHLFLIRYKIKLSEKVSIIIPSKNKTDLCRVAVESIFKLTNYPDFEVILIDNNSDEPEFFEFIKYWGNREPGRFRYLRDNDAFNYSRLMNKGAGFSRGKYLLLLNNDTEIIQADWMTAMVEQCQFKTTGVTGVKLLYKNNTVQHAGVIIGLGGLAGHTFVGQDKDAGGYHDFLQCITNYSALTAACLMVRRDAYNEVGGFDEALAVEYNDIDFCLKLKEKGYNNIYLPHVSVYHYESVSRGHPHKTKKSYRQHLKDVALFRSRWQKYIENDPCYNPHLTRVFTDFRLRIED